MGNADNNQKSRFLDSNMQSNNNGVGLANANYIGSNTLNSTGSNSSLNQMSQNALNGTNSNGQNASEGNQMFEKILSEVIHVSAFEQRSHIMNNDFSNIQGVADKSFKIKGLLEPTKQNLALPEGVPAPVTVLSAQPPFSSDIRLINNVAHEAQLCINNFTLNVPDNVAFDFNPIG